MPASIPRRQLLRWPLALSLPAALSACGRKKPALTRLPAGSAVLALGDSLTWGTGAAPETSYPAVLQGLTGWRIANAGVPGDTSAGALARLPGLLQEGAPQLVLVSIGGNDFLRRLPESDTRRHIQAICEQIRASGAQTLLIAVPALSMRAALGSPADHPLYADLARSLRLPLFADGWSRILARSEWRSDAVHPNATGYAHFAHALADWARQNGLL